MGYTQPEYKDEIEKVDKWVKMLLGEAIPKSNIFLSKGRCECADLFYRYAPPAVR
jgi:hypothetical protein